jgi:hypothetical protein
MQSAAGVNADLVSSRMAPKTLGSSQVDVTGMSCAGGDYALNVHYTHDFENVDYIILQYQVVPKSSNTNPIFTKPTGVLELDPWAIAGDANLTIPGKFVSEKDSDILVRLKLKSKTVLEHLSFQKQAHISELCK